MGKSGKRKSVDMNSVTKLELESPQKASKKSKKNDSFLESPQKSSKKSKKNDSFSESPQKTTKKIKKNLVSEMNGSKLDVSIEEPMVSPKKKKKSKLFNKGEAADNKVTELPNNDVWTKEESKQLLEACIKMSLKKPRIKKTTFLEFAPIAREEMSINKSADECKDHLANLIDGIKTTRTWEEILNAAIVELDNDKKEKTLTGFKKYYRENLDKIKIEHDKTGESGSKQLKTAHHMWRSLSDAEKESYSQKKETKIAKSPYEVFLMTKQEKHPDWKLSDAKSKYAELSDDKKIKYIQRYMTILEEKDEAIDDAGENESDNQTVVKGLTRADIKILLQHLEAPPQSVTPNVMLYYMKKNKLDEGIIPAKKLIEANRLFSKLSSEQKDVWKAKFLKGREKYLARVKEWKESQPKNICNLYDKVYPKVNKILSQKKRKAKLQITAPKPDFKMSFPNEPKAPPATAIELYSSVSSSKGLKLEPSKLKEHFTQLPEEARAQMKCDLSAMHKAYANKIFSFIDSLSDFQQTYYLGMNRIKLSKFIDEQELETRYPNEQFPIYKRMKFNPASATSPTKHEPYLKNLNMDYLDESISNFENNPLASSTSRNVLNIKDEKSPMKTHQSPQSLESPNVSDEGDDDDSSSDEQSNSPSEESD